MKWITVIVDENDDNGFRSGRASSIQINGVGVFTSPKKKVFHHYNNPSFGSKFRVDRKIYTYESKRDWQTSYKHNLYRLSLDEAKRLINNLHWSKHREMVKGDFTIAYKLGITGNIDCLDIASFAR